MAPAQPPYHLGATRERSRREPSEPPQFTAVGMAAPVTCVSGPRSRTTHMNGRVDRRPTSAAANNSNVFIATAYRSVKIENSPRLGLMPQGPTDSYYRR
jgi:hypothetical protein